MYTTTRSFSEEIRERFNRLTPIQQDIALAIFAGAVGVIATWIVAKWLRAEEVTGGEFPPAPGE